MKEMLGSIPDHVSNIHSFPENSDHLYCSHDLLDRAWLDPDSLVIYFLQIVSINGSFDFIGSDQNKNSIAWVPELPLERPRNDDPVYSHWRDRFAVFISYSINLIHGL